MDARLRVGRLCLLDTGVLARITRLDLKGFDFHCENGAWNGHYAFDSGIVTIEGLGEKRTAQITCYDQPPKEIARGGYNVIIPWMRARIGEVTVNERQILPEVLPEPEREFVITCTEIHSATYTVKAKSREEAYTRWQNLGWSTATDRHLVESADIVLEEV